MWDCAIVGGGPAGLTAATYLGRFRREVVLVDAGESRLQRVPCTRNVPGFPEGIKGSDLHARMQDQAFRYGALFRAGVVSGIDRLAGGFRLMLGHDTIEARTVLLATGAKLIEPDIPNIDAALMRGIIRYCPICDGFEAKDQNIAVLGGRIGAIAEAHFLRTFSDRVTYFWQGEGEPDPAERDRALQAGIQVAITSLGKLNIDDAVHIESGGAIEQFDVLYPCLGCGPQSDLARKIGAEVSAEGGVRVGPYQGTSVEGLYAAGDVLQGLDQIATACGQASIAAVAIHNELNAARACVARVTG